MSRREEKRVRTRSAIEHAALALFERHGFAATSVRDVASAAGVSRRTVYRYFPRKEEMVFAEAGTDLGALLAALERRPRGEPPLVAARGAVMGAMGHFSRDVVANRGRVIARSPELLPRALVIREWWAKGLADALAGREGVQLPTLEHRLAAGVAMQALSLSLQRWRDVGGRAGELPVIAQRVFDTLDWLHAGAEAVTAAG